VTQLYTRTYQPKDFLDIQLTDQVREGRGEQPVATWAVYHQTHGPALTVVDPEGRIIACVGIHHYWEGTGEIWLVLSALAAKYPRVVSFIRDLLSYSRVRLGYRRLQAAIRLDWPEARRFVEHMGFKQEAIMKRYGPNGADHALYALVEEVAND
jgi:hypothetical protein